MLDIYLRGPIVGNRTLRAVLVVVLLCALASPAFAEVSDKEPTLQDILVGAMIGSLVGFGACLYRPYLGGLSFLWATVQPYFLIHEIENTSVGRALIEENGPGYAQAAYAAFWCIVLAHLAGVVIHFLLRRKLGRTPFMTKIPSASGHFAWALATHLPGVCDRMRYSPATNRFTSALAKHLLGIYDQIQYWLTDPNDTSRPVDEWMER